MTHHPHMAQVAALVGDPGRAAMLAALLDGSARTAGELARVAGIAPPTATGHLNQLVAGGLLAPTAQGRHRYFRLASADVARMLEAVMVVAGLPPGAEPCRPPRIDAALREARTCYDHLAGRLAVALADQLVARGALVLDDEAGELTSEGEALLARLGVAASRSRKRPFCRPCLDWSERRPHLAGSLGAALLARFEETRWVERRPGRAVRVTPAGRAGLRDVLGLEVAPMEITR